MITQWDFHLKHCMLTHLWFHKGMEFLHKLTSYWMSKDYPWHMYSSSLCDITHTDVQESTAIHHTSPIKEKSFDIFVKTWVHSFWTPDHAGAMFVGPQCGTCFLSLIWNLEFSSGQNLHFFLKLVYPRLNPHFTSFTSHLPACPLLHDLWQYIVLTTRSLPSVQYLCTLLAEYSCSHALVR